MAKPATTPVEMLLEEAELYAIGCLAVEVTRLEYAIEAMIADLCGFNEVRLEIFVARLMTGKKSDALFAVLAPYAKTTARRATLATLKGRVSAILTERNTVIHGKWTLHSVNLGTGDFVHAARRKQHVVKASRVLDLAREAFACLVDLVVFYKAVAPRRRRASQRRPPQPTSPK